MTHVEHFASTWHQKVFNSCMKLRAEEGCRDQGHLHGFLGLAAVRVGPAGEYFAEFACRVQLVACHSSQESDLTWIFLYGHRIARNSHLHGDGEFILPRSCMSKPRRKRHFLIMINQLYLKEARKQLGK